MSLASVKHVYYFGSDEEFWKNLRFELKKSLINFEFTQVIDDSSLKIDHLVCQLAKIPPELLLIDFSMPVEDVLRLVFNLKAEFRSQNVAIVGFFKKLDNRVLLKKALALGIPTALIKEIGVAEMAQSLLDLLFPERVLNEMKDKKLTLEAQNLIRLGFVANDYIHMESSWRFAEDEIVHLETGISSELGLPFNFKILRTGDQNIYSSSKFWQDIVPVYLDELRLIVLEKRLKTYKDLLLRTPHNKKLRYEVSIVENDIELLVTKANKSEIRFPEKVKDWLTFNSDYSRPKRTRILVFDTLMRLLAEEKKFLDSLPYSIRCYSKIHDDETILKRNLPGLIVFQWESEEKGIEDLKKIVDLVSKEKNYHPLLVLFNCSLELEQLKKIISYSSLLIQTRSLHLKILNIIASKYEKSQGRFSTHGISFGDKEKRFYLSKYDERSVATFVMEFQVRKMSERAILFTSSRPIPHQSIFYIKYPVKMTLTVFRCPGLKPDESLGLIHGIGKEEKEQLLQIWEKL